MLNPLGDNIWQFVAFSFIGVKLGIIENSTSSDF